DEFQQVIDAKAIFRHVRQTRRADIFALAERLPRDRRPGIPMWLAAAVTHCAIDSLNRRLTGVDAAGTAACARRRPGWQLGGDGRRDDDGEIERQREKEIGRWGDRKITEHFLLS